jgi:hypothetical protein
MSNYMMQGLSEDQKTITVKLKAVPIKKDSDECVGCYFEHSGGCTNGCCTSSERKDGRTIIWKQA